MNKLLAALVVVAVTLVGPASFAGFGGSRGGS